MESKCWKESECDRWNERWKKPARRDRWKERSGLVDTSKNVSNALFSNVPFQHVSSNGGDLPLFQQNNSGELSNARSSNVPFQRSVLPTTAIFQRRLSNVPLQNPSNTYFPYLTGTLDQFPIICSYLLLSRTRSFHFHKTAIFFNIICCFFKSFFNFYDSSLDNSNSV